MTDRKLAMSMFASSADYWRARADAAEKDAARYRWLRDVGDATWMPLGKRPGVQFSHQIDAAIDAAMKDKP